MACVVLFLIRRAATLSNPTFFICLFLPDCASNESLHIEGAKVAVACAINCYKRFKRR